MGLGSGDGLADSMLAILAGAHRVSSVSPAVVYFSHAMPPVYRLVFLRTSRRWFRALRIPHAWSAASTGRWLPCDCVYAARSATLASTNRSVSPGILGRMF
jgi:hypothetical protein